MLLRIMLGCTLRVKGARSRGGGGPWGRKLASSNSFRNRLSGNNLLRHDSLLVEVVAAAVQCCICFLCQLCSGLQVDTSVRSGTITTAMAAAVQQYTPRIGVSVALLVPCYVAVTHSMTVQRAFKRGADWLVPRAMLQAVARQEVL